MSLAPGTRLALRPFEMLRAVPSGVEGRQAQGDLERSRKVGPYEVLAHIGEGGPPPLASDVVASYGASPGAMEGPWP